MGINRRAINRRTINATGLEAVVAEVQARTIWILADGPLRNKRKPALAVMSTPDPAGPPAPWSARAGARASFNSFTKVAAPKMAAHGHRGPSPEEVLAVLATLVDL